MRTGPLLLLVALALSGPQPGAQAEGRDSSALKGLGHSLCILVEEPDADAKKAGVTAEKLKAALEEDLKKAGFGIDGVSPCLNLVLRTHALAGAGLVSHYVELALVEEVSPTRNGALRIQARTWTQGAVGLSLSARLEPAVMATAAGSLAVFVDDYQLVHDGK